MREKRTGKTKGYGFVSFSNPSDLVVALKEMNGKLSVNQYMQSLILLELLNDNLI